MMIKKLLFHLIPIIPLYSLRGSIWLTVKEGHIHPQSGYIERVGTPKDCSLNSGQERGI